MFRGTEDPTRHLKKKGEADTTAKQRQDINKGHTHFTVVRWLYVSICKIKCPCYIPKHLEVSYHLSANVFSNKALSVVCAFIIYIYNMLYLNHS